MNAKRATFVCIVNMGPVHVRDIAESTGLDCAQVVAATIDLVAIGAVSAAGGGGPVFQLRRRPPRPRLGLITRPLRAAPS